MPTSAGPCSFLFCIFSYELDECNKVLLPLSTSRTNARNRVMKDFGKYCEPPNSVPICWTVIRTYNHI